MPKYRITVGDKQYDVTAPDQETALRALNIQYGGEPEDEEMSALDQATAAAGEFAEGMLGVGDELGAFGMSVGSSVYDVFNTDKDLTQILEENFNTDRLGRNLDSVQAEFDKLERVNPVLSNVAAGTGMASGLLIPGAAGLKVAQAGSNLSKVAKVGGLTAAEGAAYGFLSGDTMEEREQGALFGAAIGGVLGAGITKVAQVAKAKASSAVEEVEALSEELAQPGTWSKGTEASNGFKETWDAYATGVSDAIKRRVSPEMGGRVQRADETAMRTNNKDAKRVLETKEMQNVIKLADEDEKFKGMMLDFAQGAVKEGAVLRYVVTRLGEEEGEAFTKYMRWSGMTNDEFNRKLGDTAADGYNYLHTQVKRDSKMTGEHRRIAGKERVNDFSDDATNAMPKDAAQLERNRGLASKGEVRVGEYENPFITNAQRVFNNRRLLELQQKFGVKELNSGADGLMEAIERVVKSKGIDEAAARDGRNAVVALIKGQNRAAPDWLRALQSSVYGGTLAGPKSSMLNVHDWPVAAWNHGLANMMQMFRKNNRKVADLERLGLNDQNMGEFVSQLSRDWKNAQGVAQKAYKGVEAVTNTAMRASGFRLMDRLGKRGVVGTVAQDAVSRAKSGKLSEKWGWAFEGEDLSALESALARTGGDIDKMSRREVRLYDELVTMGLGQQQLISAAGRPIAWLNNPKLRPLWMMRGFAIKHNNLVMENVIGKFQKGDYKGGAKEFARYMAMPGAGYAGLHTARQSMFGGENYEASPEEFMWAMADSLTGPMTLNMVGVGSSYEREQWGKNPVETLMIGVLPPGGIPENTGKSIAAAITKEDPEELAGIVTGLPIWKQIERFMEEID